MPQIHIYARRNLFQRYTPAFPHVASRCAVFLRDRHTRRSWYFRARDPRLEDRYPSHCDPTYRIRVSRQNLELRLALASLHCVAFRESMRLTVKFCASDSAQHSQRRLTAWSFPISLVTWNLTIRDAYLRYYNVMALKHEKLNHLSDMFTPSWYITASVFEIYDDSNLWEFIQRFPDRQRRNV